MKIILKKINFDAYDDLLESINKETFFENYDSLKSKVEENSTAVLIDGATVEIDFPSVIYNDIVDNVTVEKGKGTATLLLIKQLHNDLSIDGTSLPTSVLYDKHVWTYLNIVCFFDLIKKFYIDSNDDDDLKIGKIKRYYFNEGGLSKLDRTGLRWLWVIGNLTKEDDDFSLTEIAWNFIDPFKAIAECVLGRNPMVLKAFAKAIKNLGCDSRIKNKQFKTLIPKHIRSYACSHVFDSYDSVDSLASDIEKQIKIILNTYSDKGE